MSITRRRLLRLFTVVALVTAVLVPAAIAGAVPTPENVKCDGIPYDASNPNHHLLTGGTTLDLRHATEGQVVFYGSTIVAPGSTIIGSPFADIICGTPGDDTIKGKDGNDRIFGGGGADVLKGNGGDDLVTDSSDDFTTPAPFFVGAFSTVSGGSGDDYVYGGAPCVTVKGNKGDDVLDSWGAGTNAAQTCSSVFEGNQGNDTITAGGGGAPLGDADELFGGKGDDTLNAGDGQWQRLWGGSGNDTFTNLGDGPDQVADGGPGNDTISGETNFVTATGNDVWLFGGAGDDTLTGNVFGFDWMWGDYPAALGAELGAWSAGPGLWWDTFLAPGSAFPVNNTVGGNDTMSGSGGADDMVGGPGNDVINGGSGNDGPVLGLAGEGGNDTISGGTGSDEILGGSGNDLMYGNTRHTTGYDTADADTDTMGFGTGSDTAYGEPNTAICPDAGAALAGADYAYETNADEGIDGAFDADYAFNVEIDGTTALVAPHPAGAAHANANIESQFDVCT